MSYTPLWKPTVELTIRIHVALVGLDHQNAGDDGSFPVPTEALTKALQESLSHFDAPVLPTASRSPAVMPRLPSRLTLGTPFTEPFRVRYTLEYDVVHLSKELNDEYVNALASAAQLDHGHESHPHLLVPMDVVSAAMETEVLKACGAAAGSGNPFEDTEVVLLVARPARVQLLEQLKMRLNTLPPDVDLAERLDEFEYSLTPPLESSEQSSGSPAANGIHRAFHAKDGRSTCARTWIGQQRVLFLDFGARDCWQESNRRGDVAERMLSSNALGSGSFRSSREQEQGSVPVPPTAGGERTPRNADLFNAKLSSLAVSAIRTVLAPAVPPVSSSGQAHEVVIVPLLMFRKDGGAGQDVKLGDLVDIEQVSKAVNAAVLPGEEVVVFGALHSLDQHQQVAVALEKALSAKARLGKEWEISQQGFVDGDKLLAEMRVAGDALASSLLSDLSADHQLYVDLALAMDAGRTQRPDSLFRARTRVLPVFAFSLEDGDAQSTARDASKKDESLPRYTRPARHFEGGRSFWADIGGDAVLVVQPDGTTSTQSIVAGIVRSLYGAAAPNHWWSAERGAVSDSSWAHGHHPFAPHGFGVSPGDLFVHNARRNKILSRAAVAAATIGQAARVLEHFAETSMPSELLGPGVRKDLCQEGAATTEGWGRAFENAATRAGLPSELTLPVVNSHGVLHDAVVSFRQTLKDMPHWNLPDTAAAVDAARDDALRARHQATDAASELQWCQCAFERSSSPSHLPWTLFLLLLLTLCYAFARLVGVARGVLLRYAQGGTSFAVPGPRL